MKCLMVDFYAEVTGCQSVNTETARKACIRWGVPTDPPADALLGKKVTRKVDVTDYLIAECKAKHEVETKRHPTTINERILFLEKTVADLIARVRALENL